MIKITLLIIFLFFVECGTDKKNHEKLNGTWRSDLISVTFNFENNTYSGISLGQSFQKKLSLVKEYANIVIFKSDDSKITAQLQDNGDVILTKEGGLPVILKKQAE